MSIDWITVVAQLVNFLLLMFLLKRFLYRPILDGIDAREAEITQRMADATAAKVAANAAETSYKQLQAHHLAEQDSLLEQALQATEKQRDQLLADTRAQLQQEQQDWQKYLEQERVGFISRLQQAGATTLFALTRKALHDLADEPLENAIFRHVGKKLQPMEGTLVQAAGEHTSAVVSSHYKLPQATQTQLQQEFRSLIPNVELSFSVNPTQAPGLVVQVGGVRVEWTIDSYMEEFTALLAENTSAAQLGMQGENVRKSNDGQENNEQ